MADMYTIEKVQKIRYAHRLAAPDVFINELQNSEFDTPLPKRSPRTKASSGEDQNPRSFKNPL